MKLLFPIAWTVLYAFMGVGVTIMINSAASGTRTLDWCVCNIIFDDERENYCIVEDNRIRTGKMSKQERSKRALHNIYKEQVEKAIFIPLLVSDAPYESGNYISRLLVQNGIIEDKRCIAPTHNDFINWIAGQVNNSESTDLNK